MKKTTSIIALLAISISPIICQANGIKGNNNNGSNTQQPSTNMAVNPGDANYQGPVEPPITSVEDKAALVFSVFPNPATNGNFRISAASEFEYSLFDLQGKTIAKGKSDTSLATVSVPENKNRDIYSLLIKTSSGKVITKQIIIGN